MVAKTINPIGSLDKHKIGLYNDICRGITIFLVVRFLLKRTFHDKDWQLMIFHNIVGFLIYQIVINRFNYEKIFGKYYGVFDDIVKSFTIITVSSYLSKSLEHEKTFTQEYFINISKVFAGVIVYHAFIQRYLRLFIENYFTGHNKKHAVIIEDCIENIIIFAVSQQFSGKPLIDKEWMYDTLYYMICVAVYHSIIKPVAG